MNDLTGWYHYDQKPVRNGWYDCIYFVEFLDKYGAKRMYWDGERWTVGPGQSDKGKTLQMWYWRGQTHA